MWSFRKKIEGGRSIQSDVSPKSGEVSIIFLKRHGSAIGSVNPFVDKVTAKAKFKLSDTDSMAEFIEQQGLESGHDWAKMMLSKVPHSRRK